MHIRKRRAREVAAEFERDLPGRLRRWRRKAKIHEAAMQGPCPDCGGRMYATSNKAVCVECGLKRYAKPGLPSMRRAEAPQNPDPNALRA